MIKKNTEIVFEGSEDSDTGTLAGGMPLSKGDVVHLHKDDSEAVVDYEVVDKVIDCHLKGDDQIVDIKYFLRRR